MGYEIKLVVGEVSALVHDEWARSEKRYDDNSGFGPKKDDKGNIVTTGRKEHWFMHMATIELCKIGSGPLADLSALSHKIAKEKSATDFHYYFADDGNTHITEDKYGDGLWPMPIAEVIEAISRMPGSRTYRRFKWAKALLKAMHKDDPKLHVIFFGY